MSTHTVTVIINAPFSDVVLSRLCSETIVHRYWDNEKGLTSLHHLGKEKYIFVNIKEALEI